MSTFDWLVQEVSTVRTPKFLRFRPVPLEVVLDFERRLGRLPEDYRAFLTQFGEANLIRHQSSSWHWLNVTVPQWTPHQFGDVTWLRIGGFLNSGHALLRWHHQTGFEDGVVHGGETFPGRQRAKSFADWLQSSFTRAKKTYSKAQWRAILEGPQPFDDREKELVEAISRYSFSKSGVTVAGNLLIEVSNQSKIQIPYLTIGVNLGNGLDGSVAVPVGTIEPGATRVIEREVYKGVVPPETIELFRLPLPEPEDREYYYEFGIPTWLRKRGVHSL